jgi:hypothetical protein
MNKSQNITYTEKTNHSGGLAMPTLANDAKTDDVMATLLLAVTDPNSPYFLRAMSELRAMLMQQEYEKERVDRIIVALLNDKDFEKNLLVQDQLAQHERELRTRYMEAWNAYQQEAHQRALDDLKLAPEQLGGHLVTMNTKLEKDVEDLQTQLKDLDKNQTQIKEDWAKNQKQFADKYAEKLKTGGEAGEAMAIVSAEGKSTVLNDKQIARLQQASEQPNMLDLLRINPSLAVVNETEVEAQAKRLAPFQRTMQELKQTIALKEILNEMGMAKNDISGKELLAILKKNNHIMKALNDVHNENPQIANEARETVKKALVTNESYINAQIEMKKNQIQENTHRTDSELKSTQKTRSTTPQFKPDGSNPGKIG